MEENYLEHVGVKGMKWGQRRRANNDAIKDARLKTEAMRTEYNKLASELNLRTMNDPNGRNPLTKIAAKNLNDHVNLMSQQEKEIRLSQKWTTGEKVAGAVLLTAGAVTLASLKRYI